MLHIVTTTSDTDKPTTTTTSIHDVPFHRGGVKPVLDRRTLLLWPMLEGDSSNRMGKSVSLWDTRLRPYQYRWGPEQVAERVVEQVQKGHRVQVGVALHLLSEKRLLRA